MTTKKGKGRKKNEPVTGLDLMVDGYRRIGNGVKAGIKGFKKGFKAKREA